VAAFPVAKAVMDYSQELSGLGERLRVLGTKVGRRWETVAQEIAKSPKKTLALHGVDFSYWQSDIEEQVDFRLAEEQDVWTLRPYTEDQQTLLHLQGSYELLNVVRHVLEKREEEGLSARDFQNLAVPDNPEPISKLIDAARDPNSSDIREFKQLFREADQIVARAYGLNQDQWHYIQGRLADPPFDVLEPRWAWKAVEMREIQEYDVDRFA